MGLFRMLAYPLVRPLAQARDSFGRVRGDLRTLKAARDKRAQALEEQIRLAEADGFEYSPEQLRDPRLIANPRERFQAVARFRGWTEPELTEQALVYRRTKLVCLIVTAGTLGVSFASMFMVPVWALLLVGPVTFTCATAGFAFALKAALFQSQFERRSLHGVKDYMARPDLLRHLFT